MEGKILGNRYELLERIGMGGMAVVYKAKDKMLNRYVAVKILRDEFKENEEFIRRFNVESQAAASLSHQNIVQIYDVGEEDGMHYIVMEFLEGITLKQYIKDNGGRLSWREAANYSMQICRALEHAHSKHVVHRDIKPQNIIITESGKIKVADFGIARAANNSTTVNANAIGSAHYLSPEQARGGYTDGRSDIYSLGIVMYEMFTGKLPYDGENTVAVIMKHLNDEPEHPCAVNPDLPRGIEAIILKAMMKEQRFRYENVGDVLEDIINVYQNPTIKISELHASAHTDSEEKNEPNIREHRANEKHTQKHRKRKKKNKGLIFAAVIAALLVAMIASYGIWVFISDTGDEIPIPNLHGMTYEEAVEAAREASSENVVFDVVIDRSEHSDSEKDTIISQTPESGISVKRSREIKVVISSGTVAAELEDYVGKDFETIRDELKEKGIKVIRKDEDSDTYEEGIIIKQVPTKGTELTNGDEVTLYVSKGEKNTIVPDVIGKNLEEAIVLIERNKLKVGEIKKEAKDDFKKGQVFKQSKGAFARVPENTVINLYVATGEKEETQDKDEQDNTDENTGQENSRDKTQTHDQPVRNPKKAVNLTFGNLPTDRDKVNIKLVLDGQTFFEKDFSTSSGTAGVTIETDRNLSLDVYYDGVYITTKEVKY